MGRRRGCGRWLAVLAAMTVAAAPATPAQPQTPAPCTRPAMVVFDGSGSMMATTDGVSRLQSAKSAMERVVPPVSAIRPVGLTVYSGNFNKCDNVRLLVPPELGSGPAILDALRDVQPGGATPLGAAVRRSVTYFREQAQAGTLVIVTDGEENCGDNICELAGEIANATPALEVHVIGYGLDRQQEEFGALPVEPQRRAVCDGQHDRRVGRRFAAGAGLPGRVAGGVGADVRGG